MGLRLSLLLSENFEERSVQRFIVIALAAVLAGCESESPAPSGSAVSRLVDEAGNTAPTRFTETANAEFAETLPLADEQDFADARRGFIARDEELRVVTEDGQKIWDMREYDFIEGDAPASVNPSLWRQARLNGLHGLFQVTDRVYQLRGFDLANMTLIEGATGWIVVDPLTAEETARKALAFARRHLGEKPVSAVVFTHSHVDHFGGVLGILEAAEAARRQVPIVAPEGFIAEATSENILAGIAMARRSLFMFGPRLPRGPRGHVGSGLGKGPAYGTMAILPPTDVVTTTPEERTIDGVRFVFQNAPGSEAPAELTFYLPELKAFCGAEVVSHTMHNLYTLRGAQVRDALKWTGYIDEMIELFGDAKVYFGSHHWPIWGSARITDFLEKQRDTYKFIHDQTVRLALQGHTPSEIAGALELPEALRPSFANRGYYGTVEHNAKAVYQRYFGWYDGNPAHLDPLPPAEAAVRYVELMGGAEEVLQGAQAAYDRGEYRWVAQLLNHLVFAQPENGKAREALARAYDQLAYQAESGPWRDVYLTGAYELRHGAPEQGFDQSRMFDLARHAPVERFLDAMASRLNAGKVEGEEMKINMIFTDLERSFVLELKNSVLHYLERAPDAQADATLKVTLDLYLKMSMGMAGLRETLFSDDLDVDGSRLALLRFMRSFDKPKGTFAIVTP